jgi:pSer/pThr/pTyr-binding forkhead associated (FHA) protein
MKTGDMVSLVGRENYTLGRSAGNQAIVPDVDLDTYGAQDQGISRLHAEIRLDETGIHVVDLDSVNGTLINGKRIEPQEPKEIRNKDIIQLGNMQLQVISRIRG